MAAACEDHCYVLTTCTITDARSPVIITIALYGTHMAHIFIWVCALIYNGVLPSIFARHLGYQYLPQTAGHPAPLPRCSGHQAEVQMHGSDRSGRVVNGRNKHIDQRQPQVAGGARMGMHDRRDPRPVAGTQPGSSLWGGSYRGVRSKTIPQLSHVSPDVRRRPLPAIGAGQREDRVQ